MQWYQTATPESNETVLTLTISPGLFAKLPGLRSARGGWELGKLGLPRQSLQGAGWLPRDRVWPATVAGDGRNLVNVTF